MADTDSGTTQPNDQEKVNEFIKWLEEVPEALAKFVEIVQEFWRTQREVDVPGLQEPKPRPDGPRHLRPGDEVELTTVPITQEQLDALSKSRADAQVKEKAVEFIRGFLVGLMMMA